MAQSATPNKANILHLQIIVTRSGDPTSSENAPEVLFLDENCSDLIEVHGLSGAPVMAETTDV